MKRSLILLWLAAICCALAASCGGAKNQNGKETGASGAGNNATSSAPAETDVVFAREVVEDLLGGDQSVAEALDWENLKVLGADAGRAYRELPNDENREDVREGFIEEFSESFKASGASVGDLKNWREQEKQGERLHSGGWYREGTVRSNQPHLAAHDGLGFPICFGKNLLQPDKILWRDFRGKLLHLPLPSVPILWLSRLTFLNQ